MRYVIFFLAFVFSLGANAQSTEELQNEIDKQVWKPFQMAFESLDGEALNAIYAEKVLRVTPEGIDTEGVFRTKNLKRFEQNKAEGISITLDFWFDRRNTNNTTSYEVGFYRIGFTSEEGKTDYVYGQFHIVLQKIEGLWKITQDWDTTTINGKAITSEDFDNNPVLRFR
ncbi:MAG: hypothetical protein AAF039_12260 [Bacteroidota bacterium]